MEAYIAAVALLLGFGPVAVFALKGVQECSEHLERIARKLDGREPYIGAENGCERGGDHGGVGAAAL